MDSFNKQIDVIKEKLGEENSALISDELLSLMTEHKTAEDNLVQRDEEIVTLKAEKENLVSANSKLFQRIGFENNLGTSTFQSPSNGQVNEQTENIIEIGDLINEKGEFL